MDLFQQNLEQLRKKEPSLSERTAHQGASGSFRVVMSRSGLPTLLHTDAAGKSSFLHSPVDPSGEARRQAEKYRFDGNDGTILYGFGLGYLAQEIVRRMDPGHVLYVVECMPEIFKLAITHLDLTEILAHDRVFLFLDEGIDQVVDRFSPIQQKILTGKINKLIAPPLKALCPSKYEEVDARINEHVLSVQVSFSSFNNMKGLLLSNFFRNTSCLLDSYPVECLRGRLEKRPALVVSAGPSLDRAVEAIKRYGGDIALISVDAAVKPLVRNGIVPHWVVSCDPLPVNRNKVQDLSPEVLLSATLVFQTDGCPELIGSFRRNKFFCGSPNSLSHWLVNVGRTVSPFPPFQGASHLAFLLARLMGADPIIFVGLDLAFPEERHHAEGCGQTWSIDCTREDLPLVPANDGGMVKSAPIFMTMIQMIGRDVMKTRSRCINVSSHGAVIRGTESMDIEEAMNAWRSKANQPVPSALLNEDIPRMNRDHVKTAVADALQWMISEAETLNGVTEQAIKGSIDNENKASLPDGELRRLYLDASGHAGFLKAISDFLPRYMVSDARRTGRGSNEKPGASASNPDEETVSIFFEEIHGLMPDLLLHSREALRTIQDDNHPSHRVSMQRKVLLILPLDGGSLIVGGHVADALENMDNVRLAVLSSRSLFEFYRKSFGHIEDEVQRNKLILEHVNLSAIGAVADFRPELVLVMALAPIAPSFVETAGRLGAVTAHWYVENFRYAPTHPLVPPWRLIAPCYNHFFTIQKEPFFSELRKAGAREVHYLPTGCNPLVQRPVDKSEINNPAHFSDICFVGSPYPNRVALFKSIPEFNMALWGPGWSDIPELKKWAKGDGTLVNSRDEACIINGAKIAINVHSSLENGSMIHPSDFLNPRVFTIAACGTFQFVNEQDNLHELFEQGEELATYHDVESFVSGLQDYLRRPEERQRMARRALTRALSEHTYRKRIERILEITGIH